MNKRIIPPILSILLSLFLVGSQLFVPSVAFACFCPLMAESGTFDNSIDKYDAVFLGKAIREKDEDLKDPSGFSITRRVFLFEVRSSWKGVDQTEVLVRTGSGYGDCGLDFELGQT